MGKEVEDAKRMYEEYRQTQEDFEFPEGNISVEDLPDERRVEVHMEVKYRDTDFEFISMKAEDSSILHSLYGDPVVVEKFASGKPKTVQETENRVKQLSARFAFKEDHTPQDPQLHLQGGFLVSDAEEGTLLGICNLGGSGRPGQSEMAFLNHPESWSHPPAVHRILKEYEVDPKRSKTIKQYSGVATTEVAMLTQYVAKLKLNKEVCMTARIDNPGSWKAGAKSNMRLNEELGGGVDVNPTFGPDLRYQLIKPII